MHFTKITLLLILLGTPGIGQSGYINASEKELLNQFLNTTYQEITSTLNSISETEWTFKPDKETWSVGQCMSHILQAESALLAQIKAAQNDAVQTKLKNKLSDGWLISKIADRGNKVKTPLNGEPDVISIKEALNHFKLSRKNIQKFIDLDLPLRKYFGKSPYGPADTYQLLLVIAGHSMRHHQQMLEVLKAYKEL